jgi:tRNA pseudouridine65 synthase
MFKITYEDDNYVVIDKPSKLLVHRSAMSRDRRFLLQELRNQLGHHVFPAHRLDRPTSGLIIFCKNRLALQRMSELFQKREVHKTYWAVVRGWCGDGTIDKPLKRVNDQGNFLNERIDALTHYHELHRYELPFFVDKYPKTRYSLVEIKPETGRYHQIRRHLKSLSHPILGDTKYGKPTHNNFLKEQIGIDRLMLVANRLQFTHPYTQEPLDLQLEMPPEFKTFLAWVSPYKIDKKDLDCLS